MWTIGGGSTVTGAVLARATNGICAATIKSAQPGVNVTFGVSDIRDRAAHLMGVPVKSNGEPNAKVVNFSDGISVSNIGVSSTHSNR